MLDRAQVIDRQFIEYVKKQTHVPSINPLNINIGLFKEIFSTQMKSRHIDLYARILKDKGKGYYSIGSSGHEGMAAVAAATYSTDPAFLHYRDLAFYIQRAQSIDTLDPICDTLLSLVASKEDPIASGRHKVIGSKPLWIPPQTSTIASHLPKALGAALGIERAKRLGLPLDIPDDSIVIVTFGDASFNHATAQATFNACEWWHYQSQSVPIVFVCEDNEIGISVPTPEHWIEDALNGKPCLHYFQANGLEIEDAFETAEKAVNIARERREPVFLHFKCVRLMGHAGSDVEEQYKTEAEIEANEARDPLLASAARAIQSGVMTPDEILSKYEGVRRQVKEIAEESLKAPKLGSAREVMESILPSPPRKQVPKQISRSLRQNAFCDVAELLTKKRNMSQLINFALTDLLLQYPNLVAFGEDVGKKGGVYRVTADLQKRFGAGRIFDTLLDETSILGTAIGMSQMGLLPIPEIQFLAYLHNAEDQLRGEAATLSFFSSGQYCNPMVIRIAALAYQKGFGGHFHNDNSIAVLRDIPGIIVACPSNGADAAKLLRTCLKEAYLNGRVVVFLEPIALYMAKDLVETGDGEWLFEYPEPEEMFELGEVGLQGSGNDYLIITYGNGYYLSRQAQELLQQDGIKTKVMDLRWLAPLPAKAILKEAKKAKHILIVDECRRSGSVSEALVTLLVEQLARLPKIKRITAEDSFIPLGETWQYLLPKRDDIIQAIYEWHNQAAKTKTT